MQFSPKQQEAVDHHKGSLLVSAAAGSGKTTTMVGHVLKLLKTETIDRFIILTYTRAAAGEMRQRIMKSLSDLLVEEPDNQHIRQQLFAAGSAYIGTIDSFCIKLVRDHFDRLDLSPDLRIADERELAMLADEVVTSILEEAYEEGRDSFFDLRTDYGNEKGHTAIREMILELHSAAQNDPDPLGWLEQCIPCFQEDPDSFFRSEEGRRCFRDMQDQLEKLAVRAKALRLYLGDRLEDKVRDALERDRLVFERLLACDDPDAILQGIEETVFPSNLRPKDKDVGALLKQYRGSASAKDTYIGDLYKAVKASFRGKELEWHFLKRMEGSVRELIRLTVLFTERFEKACREKNMAGFAGMEHHALQLLMQKNEEGAWVFTDLALELQNRYREVIVDEYQDVNQLQEYILQAMAGPNLYMVGDVKQSIYRFRRAKPSIFVEKYQRYQEDPTSLTRRVDLSENHRSYGEILEGANEIFRAIMTPESGGVDYDEKASLIPSDTYKGGGAAPRAVLVETDSNADEKIKEIARYMAGEIRRLIESGETVYDKEIKAFRPIRPRDITVLMRTLSRAREVVEVLNEFGIPATFPHKKGYYEQQEVKWMLSLLALADNPRQDVPLAAVMLSPLEGFTADELVDLSCRQPGERHQNLWSRLQAAAGEERIARFLERIEQWRRLAAYMPLPELILKLYRISGLKAYLEEHPQAGHYDNIRMLVDLAEAFEGGYGKGLYQFLHYLELQKKINVEDRGEADHLPAGLQTVEINTIHSSKGLEYPVVFLAEADKAFSKRDAQGDLLTDEKEGIALKSKDAENYIQSTNLAYERIKNRILREVVSDEIRLLYVAMTRARERFYLLGGINKTEEKRESKRLLDPPPMGPLPADSILCQNSYLDLYLLVTANRRLLHMEEEKIRAADLPKAEDYRDRELLWEDGDRDAPEVQREEMFGDIPDDLYPYPLPAGMKAAYSVSELKTDGHEDGKTVPGPCPAWLCGDQSAVLPSPPVPQEAEGTLEEGERLNAGARGTAYHKAMEHLPWEEGADAARVALYLEDMEKRGLLSGEEKKSIRPRQITAFFTESVGKRSLEAFRSGRLHREQPFLMALPYGEVDPTEASEETVLIQGIIDLFFEEGGKLILVDYKTDRDVTAEELVRRHGKQMSYYARALEAARNQPVTEIYIYSFSLGCFVSLSGERG